VISEKNVKFVKCAISIYKITLLQHDTVNTLTMMMMMMMMIVAIDWLWLHRQPSLNSNVADYLFLLILFNGTSALFRLFSTTKGWNETAKTCKNIAYASATILLSVCDTRRHDNRRWLYLNALSCSPVRPAVHARSASLLFVVDTYMHQYPDATTDCHRSSPHSLPRNLAAVFYSEVTFFARCRHSFSSSASSNMFVLLLMS